MKKLKFILISILVASLLTLFWSSNQSVTAQLSEDNPTSQIVMNSGVSSQLTIEPYYAGPKAALVASTIIEGPENVILVDSQYVLSEASKVADKIAATGKTLQAIWITHAHPDHYLGLEAVLAKFPDTPVYSTADVVEVIKQRTNTYIEGARQNYGDDITTNPVFPEVYTEDFLELDGEKIEIIDQVGDAPHIAMLNIPTANTLIAADTYYLGTHLFMIEANNPEARQAWMETIDFIKALNPELVVPGHKAPNASLDNSVAGLDNLAKYIETYGNAVSTKETAEEAMAMIQEAFPDYPLPFLLNMSLQAAYADSSMGM
ncbi:MAG: MBL fold metallo-hydrolase [Xenococcus sp. (in: cyanobacteria)]